MKQDNQKILNMITISEEINSLNNKVQQLMRDLHGAGGVLGSIQELSSRLQEKVGEFNGNVSSYEPPIVEEEDGIDPSWKKEGIKRERVIPTPDDAQSYTTEEMITPVVEEVAIEEVVVEKPKQKATKVTPKPPTKKTTKMGGTRKRQRKAPTKRKTLFGDKSVGIDKFSNKESK